MNQMQLLPVSYEDLVPDEHIIRAVNSVINNLDLNKLHSRYKEAGGPACRPQMMLKVPPYACTQKTDSSRQTAQSLCSDQRKPGVPSLFAARDRKSENRAEIACAWAQCNKTAQEG